MKVYPVTRPESNNTFSSLTENDNHYQISSMREKKDDPL
jgi:hypothetical protein